MNQVFEIVDIIAFDIHTSIQPLLNSAVGNPGFVFLFDPADYAKQHTSAAPLPVAGFTLQGLASKRFQSSIFWRQCASILHGPSPDFWKLQIPFHCTPPNWKVEFAPNLPKTRATLIPSIYLSSMGWSTSLHVRVFGSLTSGDLFNLVAHFRNDPSFLVAKSPKRLSDIFKSVAEMLKKKLYVPPPPGDWATTQRYMVVSIAKFKQSSTSSAGTAMSDADRAELHSIILGRQIGIQGFPNSLAKPGFLQVNYNDSDFSLTYFGFGTILWVEGQDRPRRRSTLWCLASNLGACSMYMLSLADFLKITEQTAAPAPNVTELRKGIQFTLSQLGSAYNNRFCREFLHAHRDLKNPSGNPW